MKQLRLLSPRPILLIIATALSLLASACSTTRHGATSGSALKATGGRVEYDSNQLRMKDADEITGLVRDRIQKSQEIQAQQDDIDGVTAEPEAIDHLRDALRIVLSRPDQDGARNNGFARLRRELGDLNAYEQVIEELASEGIRGLQSKTLPANIQATYIVMLEGLMAEVKPDLNSNASSKKVIESIRDANLSVPDSVKRLSFSRSMGRPASPSETAASILPKK